MTSEWRAPEGEVALTGTVVYRCHACDGDIPDGEAVFIGEDDHMLLPGYLNRPLPPATRTFHYTHRPRKEI